MLFSKLINLSLQSRRMCQPLAVNCTDETIETVSDDGSIISMISGSVYSVDAGDESTSSTWLASDDVLICNDNKIINKSENGESVDVTPGS
jgi:hypothetical protein